MPSIALATYAALPSLASDEPSLIAALGALGIHGAPATWDDPAVDWARFDAVVVRSCWDYHLRPDEFFHWVDRVSREGVAVWNSPPVLRWNSRKTYLRDLAAAGVRTVPTIWLDAGRATTEPPLLESILNETGWAEAIVKPVISASAHETWRVTPAGVRADAAGHAARVQSLVGRGGAMVQPFIPDVVEQGEWSLLFFGGTFSHAVIKRVAPGDFRVQRAFGGTHERVTASPAVVAQAEAALAVAPGATVYARVDGVVMGEALTVTELELLEPSLFLDADPLAPARFARAIAAVLDRR